jgi:HAD superfamily phosphoserine phosphatase-like hydrolase
VFDLDGTLVGRGSLPRFVHQLAGCGGLARALAAGAVALLRSPRPSRFKPAALDRILRGRPVVEVRAEGRRFALRLLCSDLRDPVMRAFRRHRHAGDHLVLLTSALDVYAEPLGDQLGFDAVLATRVVVDGDRRCTGELLDADLAGIKKAVALEQYLIGIGADPARAVVHVYADGRVDRPLVRWVEQVPPRPHPGESGARGEAPSAVALG